MSIHFNTIQATQSLTGLNRMEGTSAPRQNDPTSTPSPLPKDELQLSQAARDIATGATESTGESASLSNVRLDLVNRIREEIAAGTYETPEKFAAALDTMVGRLSAQ